MSKMTKAELELAITQLESELDLAHAQETNLRTKLGKVQEELETVKADAGRELTLLLRLSRFLTHIDPVLKEKGLAVVGHVLRHMIVDDMKFSEFVDEYAEDIAAIYLPKPKGSPTTFSPQIVPIKDETDFCGGTRAVKLMELGPEKLKVIKIIRTFTGASLKEALKLSESSRGTVIAQGLPWIEAANMVAELEDVGCEATMISE